MKHLFCYWVAQTQIMKWLMPLILVASISTGTYAQCNMKIERTFPCQECVLTFNDKINNLLEETLLFEKNLKSTILLKKEKSSRYTYTIENPPSAGQYSGFLDENRTCSLEITFVQGADLKLEDFSKNMNIHVLSATTVNVPLKLINPQIREFELSHYSLSATNLDNTINTDVNLLHINKHTHKDTIVTQVDVPIVIGHTYGQINAQLQMVDEYSNLHTSVIQLSVKHNWYLPIATLVFGLLIGLLFKYVVKNEKKWLRNNLIDELTNLILKHKDLIADFEKYIQRLNKLRLRQNFMDDEEFNAELNSIKNQIRIATKHQEVVPQLNYEDDKIKLSSYGVVLIFLSHLVISFLFSLVLFKSQYVDNTIFGSFWDYFLLILTGISISFATKQLIGERLEMLVGTHLPTK